jgi:uncharacterized protein
MFDPIICDTSVWLYLGRLGLQTTGSLGVLLLAKQAGLITAVRPLLAQLQAEGFYISQPLLQRILKQAREE